MPKVINLIREKKTHQIKESMAYHFYTGAKYKDLAKCDKKPINETIISLKKKKIL